MWEDSILKVASDVTQTVEAGGSLMEGLLQDFSELGRQLGSYGLGDLFNYCPKPFDLFMFPALEEGEGRDRHGYGKI